MGSNSQRRKEQSARKLRQARKKQAKRKQETGRGINSNFSRSGVIDVGNNTRHRERLARQKPQAWANETDADVAIFADTVLSTLPLELAEQVTAVRDALQAATESRGEVALKRIALIPRGSPLSEWRLFIRGLVDWLANNTTAAEEAWERLDTERRPGRIATALRLSLRTDLEAIGSTKPPENIAQPADSSAQLAENTVVPETTEPINGEDEQLLYHAKLVRRVRFERAALRVAETGVRFPEEDRQLKIGPRKIQWVKDFVKEYGDTEPELAAGLAQTALRRVAAQNYDDLFVEAARSLSGPRHDRQNNLLRFFYYIRFQDDPAAAKSATKALDQYLTRDLPQNESLPQPLRAAMASQIHLYEANSAMQLDSGIGSIIQQFLAPSEDAVAIRKHLQASIKAYPLNLETYKSYRDWLSAKLDNDRLKPRERKALESELTEVMQSWSRGLPDQAEPRLWLLDHYLENEDLLAAKPHVDFLAASRQEDPRVRATPWKWQLLEAKRLSRLKSALPKVSPHLDEAEKLWPTWLPKQWLPYLRAAWLFRAGQADAFESMRAQICQESGLVRDSLADACMMLGAAQMLQVPSSDLKQLREPVDANVNQLSSLPLADLLAAGGFFWDLHRTKLVYPAYRMHGGKIGKALLARWKKPLKLDGNTKLNIAELNIESIHKALLWSSEYRFWSLNYQITLPAFYLDPTLARQPMFAAARLNAFLKTRYQRGTEPYNEAASILREAALTGRDAYYLYWFTALADDYDDALAKEASQSRGSPFGAAFGAAFANMFGGDKSDDDAENGMDDFFDFDPNCNCPDCQAARRASKQAAPKKRK